AAAASRSRGGLLAAVSVMIIAGLVIVIKNHLPWDSAGYPLGMRAGYAFVWGYSLINVCAILLITCLANRRFFPALFEFATAHLPGQDLLRPVRAPLPHAMAGGQGPPRPSGAPADRRA